MADGFNRSYLTLNPHLARKRQVEATVNASCKVCNLAAPTLPVDGVPLVRCILWNAKKNPNDCCVRFMSNTPGIVYPKGSRRDVANSPNESLFPSDGIFDPKRGLL